MSGKESTVTQGDIEYARDYLQLCMTAMNEQSEAVTDPDRDTSTLTTVRMMKDGILGIASKCDEPESSYWRRIAEMGEMAAERPQSKTGLSAYQDAVAACRSIGFEPR